MPVFDNPFVSVIIPVYNDADRLKLCLTALSKQTYPQKCFEIIVVDNGSDHPKLTQVVVNGYSNARLDHEALPGSYAARNRGIAIAQGEIMAFTDADCLPEPDWLLRGVRELQRVPNCGQVIGNVKLFFANPRQPTPVELYEFITAFPQERLLKEHHGGATANLFTWKKVVETVGMFDAQLKSNGDLEWGQRVYAHGYQQVYVDTLVVKHPTRSSWRELCSRTRRLVGGNYDLKLKKARTNWQRQVIFIRTLLYHLMPPVFFTVNAFGDRRLQSVDQKLKVSGVMVLVRSISAWETVRLRLGKASSRV